MSKVIPMNPRNPPGYGVGLPVPGPQPARPPSNMGRTIVIAAVSMAAGALLVKMVDRAVFSRDRSELDLIKDKLAEQAGSPRALAPAPVTAPAPAVAPVAPPPGYVRIDVPREAMNDEFWAMLAGEYQ